MSDDSFTRAEATVQGTEPTDYSNMSAEDLLQMMMAGPTAAHKETAEAKALFPVKLKYAAAAEQRLHTGLPPEGEEELHPNHWLVVHRGVSQKSVHQYGFPVSNIYNIFLHDSEGVPTIAVIAAGLNWLPKTHFSGAFDDPRDQLLAKAHAAGLLEIIPPGMPLDVRTLGAELLDKIAEGAAQLCTDPRTLRFMAHLAGGVNKAWLLRKADDLESGAKQSAKQALKPQTVGEFAKASRA